jgi:hypothetical protein
MQKNPKPTSIPPTKCTPAVFTPVVVSVPGEDFKITETQFAQLEEAGHIVFSQKLRTDLTTLRYWHKADMG